MEGDFYKVQFRAIRRYKFHVQVFFFPAFDLFFEFVTGVNRGIINDYQRRRLPALVEKIEALNHHVSVNQGFEGERMEPVMEIEKAQHVVTRPMCGGQLQHLPYELLGVRDTRLERESGFVEIPKVELARVQKRFEV